MSDFRLEVVYIGERRICMDDNGIIQMYWDRNDQAIKATSDKYGHYCKAIAKNILNNEEDAEECVNDTYLNAWNAMPTHWTDLTNQKDQLVYLGTISSKVSSSQYPQANFQANNDIIDSVVYQYGSDVVVENNGQYWLYRAILDVDYTTNNDGTYTCRSKRAQNRPAFRFQCPPLIQTAPDKADNKPYPAPSIPHVSLSLQFPHVPPPK